MEKKTKAHVISHSHWDREWYMPFEEHRYYLVQLIDTLLDMFENDPQFKSFHLDGQTIILEDYLEIKPDKKEDLKKLIQAEKLHIGPWYVLQDAFLTSSEANVRNMLYGLKDAKEYGKVSKIGYYPDTFGIYGQAPQILKQAGIETAAFGRGVKPTGFNNTVGDSTNFESPYSELSWQSPDGSKVLGILFANWYSNGNEIPVNREEVKVYWEARIANAKKYASSSHLLFMNGCDHQPAPFTLTQGLETAEELFPEVEFIHSNFDGYVEALNNDLPDNLQTITGEIRSQRTNGWSTLVNTASARIYLKQMNQECQTLLEKVAEPMSALSFLLTNEYPRDYLQYAWKTLMKNHPHDSICGCSVDEVHREMVNRFEKSKQTAMMIVKDKANELASNIDTRRDEKDDTLLPIVVFNTSGNKRSFTIDKEIIVEKVYFSDMQISKIARYLEEKELPCFQIVDIGNQEYPCDVLDRGVRFGYDLPGDGFRRPYYARFVQLTFTAEALPEIGYRTFYLKKTDDTRSSEEVILKNERELENEWIHLAVHEDGSYDVTDKASGKTYKDLGVYSDTGDIGNEYMFKSTLNEQPITTKGLKAAVKTIKNTSVQGIIEITHQLALPVSAEDKFEEEKRRLVWFTARKSKRSTELSNVTLTTQIRLDRDARGPIVQVNIENNVKDHRLRVLFPTHLNTETHYADSIFEVVKRPNTPEKEWVNPSFDHHQQAFVSLSDQKHGLTIVNKGLNEYEILEENNTIAVTILRSVSELGDWGEFPTPEAQCIGTNTAEWQIIPHSGTVINSEVYKAAYDFQIPAVVQQTDLHTGSLPANRSYLEWKGASLAFSSFKIAEERDDLIVRWYNTSDKETMLASGLPTDYYQSNIIEGKNRTVPNSPAPEKVRPYEIITLGCSLGES